MPSNTTKKLNANKKTDVITVRLRIEHIEALKKLPPGETPSSLVRGLVGLYIKGLIPKSWVKSES